MNSPPIKKKVKELIAHFDSLVAKASASQFRPDVEISSRMSSLEIRAMLRLAKKGSALMTDLANDLGIPTSTATHVMGRLVKKGLATRVRLDQDRRVVQVQLSEQGTKLEQMFEKHRMAAVQELLSPLSSAERETFLELMAKMNRLCCPRIKITSRRAAGKERTLDNPSEYFQNENIEPAKRVY